MLQHHMSVILRHPRFWTIKAWILISYLRKRMFVLWNNYILRAQPLTFINLMWPTFFYHFSIATIYIFHFIALTRTQFSKHHHFQTRFSSHTSTQSFPLSLPNFHFPNIHDRAAKISSDHTLTYTGLLSATRARACVTGSPRSVSLSRASPVPFTPLRSS